MSIVNLAREVDRAPRHRGNGRVFEAAVRPVPVWRQNRWKRALADRTVEIPRGKKARQAFEVHLRYAVIVALDLAEHLRAKRRSLGHGHQPGGFQNQFADVRGALVPGVDGREVRRRERIVERSIRPGLGQRRLSSEHDGRQRKHTKRNSHMPPSFRALMVAVDTLA